MSTLSRIIAERAEAAKKAAKTKAKRNAKGQYSKKVTTTES